MFAYFRINDYDRKDGKMIFYRRIYMASKRYAQVGKDCVACGCCVKVCPRDAISVWKGVIAVVDKAVCIGCGMCTKECPAGEITLEMRGTDHE